MWLNAVDHVFVPLKNHHQFSAVLVPNKDAPTITAAENILLTPEISFLNLQKDTFKVQTSRNILRKELRSEKVWQYRNTA